MNRIYNFERKEPPVLSEAMLRTEIARRNIRRQTAIIATAGLLIQICIALLSFFVYEISPVLTLIGFLYIGTSLIGSGIVFKVFLKKEM